MMVSQMVGAFADSLTEGAFHAILREGSVGGAAGPRKGLEAYLTSCKTSQ